MSFLRGHSFHFICRWSNIRRGGNRLPRRRQRSGIAAGCVLLCLASPGVAQEGASAPKEAAVAQQRAAGNQGVDDQQFTEEAGRWRHPN